MRATDKASINLVRFSPRNERNRSSFRKRIKKFQRLINLANLKGANITLK